MLARLAIALIPAYASAARMAAVDAAPADAEYTHGYTAPTIERPHAAALVWLHGMHEAYVDEADADGCRIIDDMIRGDLGLGWSTADPSFKTRVAFSPRMRKFHWCGAALARALGHAGINHATRYKHMASTGRIYRHAHGTDRAVALDALQPGDVILCGAGRKNAAGRVLVEGEHIAMVERVCDGYVVTLEGNAKGVGPDGRIFEGLVRRTRPLPKSAGGHGWSRRARCPISGLRQTMEVMHAVRYQPRDFDEVAA